MTWILYAALSLAALYLSVVAALYLAQTWLIFPTYLARFPGIELPPSTERLTITAADGARLAGVLLCPRKARPDERLLLLAFGGNVWNVESMALMLHRLFPAAHVGGFHYRGYRPSEGRPSAEAVLSDSLAIYDALHQRYGFSRVVAVGFSLGSPVAAYLARHRALAGLILVTPFDSLVELARDHFRWAPVRLLIRHRMPTVEFLRDVGTPTAMIVAGQDSVVPPGRSEALRRVIPNLVFDETIAEAEHNDLYVGEAFPEAMRRALAQIEAADQGRA